MRTARGPAIAATTIFVVFAIVSWFITANGYTVPKPAEWLESWFKLFQTSVTIVVGLKIAANIDAVVRALITRQ